MKNEKDLWIEVFLSFLNKGVNITSAAFQADKATDIFIKRFS